MTKVEVGQWWADMDNRPSGRIIAVLEIDDTHALVENVRHPFGLVGRKTKISLARFRPGSRGYRLISP